MKNERNNMRAVRPLHTSAAYDSHVRAAAAQARALARPSVAAPGFASWRFVARALSAGLAAWIAGSLVIQVWATTINVEELLRKTRSEVSRH